MPLKMPLRNIGGINMLLMGEGADAAIARLKACDKETRTRLINDWEEFYTDRIRQEGERLKNGVVALAPDAIGYSSTMHYLQNQIDFCRYIVKDKGERATPLLQALAVQASGLSEKQREDYTTLTMLPVRAVSRLTAMENRRKLNALAAKRRIRIVP